MKWMIASDLHGSAVYCRRMLEAFEREGADRLLLLGDVLYHGPRNDLPEGYYVLMTFDAKPELPAELDRVLGITDGVMRSLITSVEE